jgi:hypothetical protein
MSGARMGFDLTTRIGWWHFFFQIRHYKRFPREMWKDTFGRVLCWLAGAHSIRQDWTNGDGLPQTSCTTCCRWLVQDGHKWAVPSSPPKNC